MTSRLCSEQTRGARNIFLPLKSETQNANLNYAIKSQTSPILKFISFYDNRSEQPEDQMKFRKCHILYFVEDGTIKVYEPIQRNAGFHQGCLINRNRIPKSDGKYYTLNDLNIGNTLCLFGKTFKIVNCDKFTKNYLRDMGYRVGTPEPDICDPIYADRQEMDAHRIFVKKWQWQNDKFRDFYKFHPKCLHFYAIYNYKPRPFEESCYVSLYYDLANKTIKIMDRKKVLEYQQQLQNGIYDTSLILKPTLVPKKFVGMKSIENYSSPFILNLSAATKNMHLRELMSCRSGGANNSSGFMRDSNPAENPREHINYYGAEDFGLGIIIDIFSVKVFIYDCDEFTKEFYKNELNKELIPVPLPEIRENKYHNLIYRGYLGNSEGNLQTFRNSPAIKVPNKLIDNRIFSHKSNLISSHSDYLMKFHLNFMPGCNSKTLKFLSKVITNDALMKDQYFIIQLFLEDGTIQINEMKLNFSQSTPSEGMFLKRMKLSKPESEVTNAAPCFYTPMDMYVGNVIYAVNKAFLIIDADEYSYEYMERNCDVFLHSNIKEIFRKLFPLIRDQSHNLKESFESTDVCQIGYISYNDFKYIVLSHISESAKNLFPEHQIKTLARHFAFEEYIGLNYNQLVSKLQYELKKQRFHDFDKLRNLFLIFDLSNSRGNGHFEPRHVYRILRSYPLPVDRDLLKSFLFKFPCCNGLLNYKDVVNALNYYENPKMPPENSPYAININWERIEEVKNVNKVCYNAFLKDLTSERCPNCN